MCIYLYTFSSFVVHEYYLIKVIYMLVPIFAILKHSWFTFHCRITQKRFFFFNVLILNNDYCNYMHTDFIRSETPSKQRCSDFFKFYWHYRDLFVKKKKKWIKIKQHFEMPTTCYTDMKSVILSNMLNNQYKPIDNIINTYLIILWNAELYTRLWYFF